MFWSWDADVTAPKLMHDCLHLVQLIACGQCNVINTIHSAFVLKVFSAMRFVLTA